MEGQSEKGVLNQLSLLEAEETGAQPSDRIKKLKSKVEELKEQRDRLSAQIVVHQTLQKLRTSMDNNEEEMADESENSQLLRLIAKHTELKDLLLAHHFLGGYNVMKTNKGKSMCFSLVTIFQGTMMETYNIEIDVKPTLRILRHNIPLFIPVNVLAEKTNMQKNIRGFLDTLQLHLNAFINRRQQLKLVKEMHKSVEVLESNGLCSHLVLMLTVQKTKKSLLCSLEYSDHTKHLPTKVTVLCEEQDLSDSPQWQKNKALLLETPIHKALQIMREKSHII